jgi:hypothetical protein
MNKLVVGIIVVLIIIIIAAVVAVTVSKKRAADLVAAQAQWRCVAGYNTPVRYINGDVQCLSTDGINCMYVPDAAGCVSTLSNIPANINPLSCGADHLAKWGSTGYDNPQHWCNTGKTGILGTSA